LAAAARSAEVVGFTGCTDLIAVTSTLIFQCVEKLRRPVPFTEPSFESTSLMKSMMVFWAEVGGGEADGAPAVPVVAAPSVAPEVAVPAAVVVEVAGAAAVEPEPLVDALEAPAALAGTAGTEVEPVTASVGVVAAALVEDVAAGGDVGTPTLPPDARYAAAIFREYVRFSRYAAI